MINESGRGSEHVRRRIEGKGREDELVTARSRPPRQSNAATSVTRLRFVIKRARCNGTTPANAGSEHSFKHFKDKDELL